VLESLFNKKKSAGSGRKKAESAGNQGIFELAESTGKTA
jgi:hypothetical protein